MKQWEPLKNNILNNIGWIKNIMKPVPCWKEISKTYNETSTMPEGGQFWTLDTSRSSLGFCICRFASEILKLEHLSVCI